MRWRKLCELDDARFGYFVKRTLTYSSRRRNAFTLAYRIVATLSSKNRQWVVDWVREGLASKLVVDQWSEVLERKFHGQATEPILTLTRLAAVWMEEFLWRSVIE